MRINIAKKPWKLKFLRAPFTELCAIKVKHSLEWNLTSSRLNLQSFVILSILVYGLSSHVRYKFGDFLDFKSVVLTTLFVACFLKITITGKVNNPLNDKLLFATIFYIFVKIATSRHIDPVQFFLVACIILSFLCVDVRTQKNGTHGFVGFVYIWSSLLLASSLASFYWTIIYQSDEILRDSTLWIDGFSVYEVLFGKIIAFQGLSNDPNLVGNSVVFILFFSFHVIRPRLLSLFVTGCCILAIFLSSSRGSFISMTIALSLSFALVKFRLSSRKFVFSFFITTCAFVGIANYFFALGSKFSMGANRRFLEWGQAIFIDRNIFIGADVGTIAKVLGKHSESGFINLYVEYGLIGLCLFLLVVLKSLYVGAKNFQAQSAMDRVFFSTIIFLFITMSFTSGEISFLLWISIFWILQHNKFLIGKTKI